MRRVLLALLILSVVVAACGGGDGSGGQDSTGAGGSEAGDRSITVWTIFADPTRIQIQEPIFERFTEETGIAVELVGVNGDDQSPTMVSSAASGELPDVVLHALDVTPGWVAEGILDPQAATEVVEELGAETFNESALALVETEDGYGAVPSDGWGQMLFYRNDLFEDAGLDAPETFDDVRAAAQALHGDGVSGITLGTRAGVVFTMQSFENFALANDCQLVDDAGEIALDSQACVNTIAWYSDIASNFSAGGEQDVETTRATYLAGQAAMVSWSPHFLDELANLFPDTPPTCDQCAEDPRWLVERTSIAPLIQGPDASEPAQFGMTLNLGITTGADTEAAKTFVSWLMSDGYVDFLGVSPEGRFPMRPGTADNPTQFVEQWEEAPVGVGQDTLTVRELYGQETIDTIVESATGFERWGFAQGQGALVTALHGDLELTRILRDAADGTITAEEAAAQMADHARQIAGQVGA